jgi:dTDP-4-amino-4,6-dideoxygalactose transaminase
VAELRSVVVTSEPLPFNRSSIAGNELQYVENAVSTSRTSSRGPHSAQVAELLQEAIGAEGVLLTTSCTAALELSAMLLEIKPGENVIVPSFTFVSTALAFAREGAELRFADIEADTLGLDPDSVRGLVDGQTRAVVPVHYGGIGMRIEQLQALCRPLGVSIIEDNAHGLFGSVGHRPLGSFGRFSTLSFHETKNFSCGEGGALIINDHRDVARADILYDKGTNRRMFFENQVDRYTWVDKGSSFGMSDLLAAYLLGQLEQQSKIMEQRKHIFDYYSKLLSPLQRSLGFQMPAIPAGYESGYHNFYLLISEGARRDAVLRELNESGITATFHYQPLHRAEGARPWIRRHFDCPVSESVSSRIIRLPFFNTLTDTECERVVETLTGALHHNQ